MEQIFNLTQYGLGVASFGFLVIYILTDKKQVAEDKKATNEFMQGLVKALDDNTNTLKTVNDNQKEMTNTLEKLSYRLETIEEKVNSKKKR